MRTLRGRILFGNIIIIIISFIVINLLVGQVLEKNLENQIISDLEKIRDIAYNQIQREQSITPILADISKSYEVYISVGEEGGSFAGRLIDREYKDKALEDSNRKSEVAYIGEIGDVYSASYAYPLYTDNIYQGTLILQKEYTSLYTSYKSMMQQIIGVEIIMFGVMVMFNYATHEMKTPLTAIRGYSELIEDGIDDEAVIQAMGSRITIETDRMYKFVENMLIIARGQQLQENKEWFDLKEVIEEVLDTYEVLLYKQDKRVEVNVSNIMIYGYREEIRVVCKNLLENAIKYSVGSEITIQMLVGQDVKVVYSNTLAPLPESIRDNLLEPFVKYQYNNYQQVSSGLGLFICKELMGKNEGSIEYTIDHNKIGFNLRFKNSREV